MRSSVNWRTQAERLRPDRGFRLHDRARTITTADTDTVAPTTALTAVDLSCQLPIAKSDGRRNCSWWPRRRHQGRGRDLEGRCLSFAEREEVALGWAGGESMRSIARKLGGSPSTISRELGRNAEASGRYRASSAHAAA